MIKIVIDFETYWDSKTYTLKKQSMVEYIRDRRFKTFGLAYTFIDEPNGPTSIPIWVSANDIPIFINKIANEIGWPNVAMISHNVKFDAFILHDVYECIPGQFIDTRGMSKAVLGKSIKSHHLAALAEYYGLESKGHMETDGKETLTQAEEEALASYCLHDVELCRDIYNKLAVDFPENQYAALHRTIDMFVSPKLILNVPLLEKASKEEAQRRANIFTKIKIDKSIFASNKKFPKLLEERGFPIPLKPSPRRKTSTGEALQIPAIALGDPEFLEMLEGENEELKTLCEARVAAKSTLLETRSAKLAKIGATGYWPFDVEFSGAEQTHRFSGGAGAGGNPQNFTRNSKLREAVEAPEGYELVVGDFSNIELRLVAYLSKDPGLVQAIEQGVDIYCDFASVFYGRRITKADEQERRFGKTAILGLGYGMGWQKFIKTVRVQTGEKISEEDSRKAIELYRTRYARVPALWELLDRTIQYISVRSPSILNVYYDYHSFPFIIGAEYIELPSGLKMRYPNLRQEQNITKNGHIYLEWIYNNYKKGNLEKSKLYGGKVLENICQGLDGELCKESMLKMGNIVTGLVHDEIHILCKKGLGLMTAQKLKRVMSTAPKWMPQLKLDAEINIGTNWGNAK